MDATLIGFALEVIAEIFDACPYRIEAMLPGCDGSRDTR
jgi:hypothetical protein